MRCALAPGAPADYPSSPLQALWPQATYLTSLCSSQSLNLVLTIIALSTSSSFSPHLLPLDSPPPGIPWHLWAPPPAPPAYTWQPLQGGSLGHQSQHWGLLPPPPCLRLWPWPRKAPPPPAPAPQHLLQRLLHLPGSLSLSQSEPCKCWPAPWARKALPSGSPVQSRPPPPATHHLPGKSITHLPGPKKLRVPILKPERPTADSQALPAQTSLPLFCKLLGGFSSATVAPLAESPPSTLPVLSAGSTGADGAGRSLVAGVGLDSGLEVGTGLSHSGSLSLCSS